MIDLQWVMANADTAKDVIAECLSDETNNDIQNFKQVLAEGMDASDVFYDQMEGIVKKGLDIVFDLLREPLQAAGYELPEMRKLSRESEYVKTKLDRLQTQDTA